MNQVQYHSYQDKFHKLSEQYLDNFSVKKYEKLKYDEVFVSRITSDILLLNSLQKYSDTSSIFLNQLCEILVHSQNELSHNYCLFKGRMRIIYTLLKVYESQKEVKYLEYATQFFTIEKVIEYVSSRHISNGLLNGRMGVLVGIMFYRNFVQQESHRELTQYILQEIIKNITTDKAGLTNAFVDCHIAPLTNLSEGNAGMIWAFSKIQESNQSEDLLEVTKSLVDSLNNQWKNDWSNWADNYKKITSHHQQELFLEKYQHKSFVFFNTPNNNFDFWNGTLGIILSLFQYININPAYTNKTLRKINKSLKALWESCDDNFKVGKSKELFYIYISLYKLTQKNTFKMQALSILDNLEDTDINKLPLLRCVLGAYKLDELDLVPSIHFTEKLEGNLKLMIHESLFVKSFPRTKTLIDKSDINFCNSYIFPEKNFLNSKFVQKIEKSLHTYTASQDKNHKRLFYDCINYERAIRRHYETHKNKSILNTDYIFQNKSANNLLRLNYSELLKIEFILADTTLLLESKYDWNIIDETPELENFSTPEGKFYKLINLLPNSDKASEISISENQLILLEAFTEKVSLNEAKQIFLNHFSINSKNEKQELETFVENSFELFIFNRYIILL